VFESECSLPVSRARLVGVFVAAALLLALVSAGAAHAASFTVNDPADAPLANSAGTACVSTDSGGTCTLRAAVQAADNTGGANTITLPAGTYTLAIKSTSANNAANGDLDINNGDGLTINGAGAASTVIDANHIDRAFAVDAAADSLSISGLTITGGDADVTDASTNDNSTAPGYGGAIYNDGALAVTDSVLTSDESFENGGAIYSGSSATSTSIAGSTISHDSSEYFNAGGVEVEAGTLSVTDSVFQFDAATDDNSAAIEDDSSAAATISGSEIVNNAGDGSGAIGHFGTGSLSITSSDISDNHMTYYTGEGGAVDSHDGTLSITSSTLANNSAGFGGALFIDSSGTTTLTNDTFASNAATDGDGGAIDDEDGASVTMTGDTFTGNSSNEGGALYFDGDSAQLTNTTFDGNTSYFGGAIDLETSGASFTNDTIANNGAGDGGGILAPAYATAIVNTIVADNEGGDCEGGPAGTTVDKGHNLDSDGSCFATGGTGSIAEVSGDIPDVNPDLGALSANGGPTQTDALLTGSPAIGKALGSSCPATDQRGVPRSAGACDIGAYQTAGADLALSAAAPATATVGSPVTFTFTITNNGPAAATGVTVTDPLPAGTVYFSSSSSQGSCSGTSTVVCSLGTLDSSDTGTTTSATVTITVVPGAVGTLENTAVVSSGTPDPNAANNTASASTTVNGGAVVSALVKPVVLTGVASQITSSKAKLSGIINPAGQATTYSVQYGTSKKYGKTAKGKTLKASTTPSGIVISVKGLKAGKTYHFRVVATNAAGTSYGKDVKFKTKKKKKSKHHATRTNAHSG